MTSEEKLKMEKQYRDDYGLQDGKSKFIFSDYNLKFQAIGSATKELMLFEEDENDFQQVCDAYGISRDLFAQTNKATYTNQNEALKQTYQTTIFTVAGEISMNHTKLFGMDGKTEWLHLDYSEIPVLHENEKEKAEIIKLKADSIRSLKASGYNDKQITTITGIEL